MAGNGSENTAMETRSEFMASKSNMVRVGHFLKPSFSTCRVPLPNLPPIAFTYNQSNSGPIPLKAHFKGWQRPYKPWNKWVLRMEPRYGDLWRRVGIFDAIKVSTIKIHQYKDVVLGLAEKWFPRTNTFVFKWGEASITLEDVCVLGGYSPLGDSVSPSLDPNTQKIVAVDQKLTQARRDIWRSGAKKVPFNLWIEHFQGNENEFGDLEHEAFLVFWLSKYVFPNATNAVGKHVHAIAIRLAMGVRIALAPAVLASIYRDLRILRNASLAANVINLEERKGVKIWAPMHLVQIWAWERFPVLMPWPNPIIPNQPFMARWDDCGFLGPEPNVNLSIESGSSSFSWQPYATFFENEKWTEMGVERKHWLLYWFEENENVEALVKLVRPSELVGLECIEQYLPHRVARQFGFDQDLPGLVDRHNQNYDVAWANYNRPVEDQMVNIPPRSGKTEVTTRYLAWWNRSMSYAETGQSYRRRDWGH